MTKYRMTRINLGDLHTDPTFTEVGIVTREEVNAMAKLPGWHMLRESDSEVWLNCDGLGWERLHVCENTQSLPASEL